MKIKTAVTAVFLLSAAMPAFAKHSADEEGDAYLEEQPVISADQPEQSNYALTTGFFQKEYKDGRPSYNAVPLVFKAKTGANTEAIIGADIYTFQGNNDGANDITLGFNWNFYTYRALTIGAMTALTLPSGILFQSDNGWEPAETIAASYDAGKGWGLYADTGFACMHDQGAQVSYGRWTYSGEASWQMPGALPQLYTAYSGFTPDAYQGMHIDRVYFGARTAVAKDAKLNTYVMRGIGPSDLSFSFGTMLTQKF
jgi:hypothetical protein